MGEREMSNKIETLNRALDLIADAITSQRLNEEDPYVECGMMEQHVEEAIAELNDLKQE